MHQILTSLCQAFSSKFFISACSATIVALIGENTLAYQILFILVTIDFLTGVSVGFVKKELSSRKMFRSTYKLLVYFLLVIAAHQLVRYVVHLQWLEDAIVLYVASTEMLSIIENSHKLGVPIPYWITKNLENFRDTGKKAS